MYKSGDNTALNVRCSQHQTWNTESFLKSGRKLKPEQLELPLERGRNQWIIQNTSVKGERNNEFGALGELLSMKWVPTANQKGN